MWVSHLHFEIRIQDIPADHWVTGWTKEKISQYYAKPTPFISSHRPLVSDPINLTSSNTSSNSATLNWNKPTFSNFDHYELYRSTEQNGTGDPAKRTNILEGNDIAKNIDIVSFTDSFLSPNIPYFYSLTAFDTNGFSVSSNEININTQTGIVNITNNQYLQNKPKISSKYIVWEDYTPVSNIDISISRNLHVYDLLTKEIKTFNVTIAGSVYPAEPNIYEDKVVYQSINKYKQSYGDLNIYYFYLTKDGGTGVPITEALYHQRTPQIYKNIIVWKDDNPDPNKEANLYYLDLNATDGPRPLVPAEGRLQSSPQIWENKIVYVDNIPGTLKYDISMIDIITKERTVIASQMNGARPDIDENKVVWSRNGIIYIYDINSKTTENIAANAGTAITKQNKVIYITGIANNETAIHIYDIQTKIDIEAATGIKVCPLFDYYNGILVYSDLGTSGIPNDLDIFMVKVGG